MFSKMKIIFTALLLISLLNKASLLYSQNFDINITITEIRSNSGNILYAVYNNKKFFNDGENFVRSGSVNARKGKIVFTIKDLPRGEYAISILHDENNNDKMDVNILGIPKEGFGFSNNPGIRFSAPGYKDTKFLLNNNTSITINMKYLL